MSTSIELLCNKTYYIPGSRNLHLTLINEVMRFLKFGIVFLFQKKKWKKYVSVLKTISVSLNYYFRNQKRFLINCIIISKTHVKIVNKIKCEKGNELKTKKNLIVNKTRIHVVSPFLVKFFSLVQMNYF